VRGVEPLAATPPIKSAVNAFRAFIVADKKKQDKEK
jgi:hypothetical protein